VKMTGILNYLLNCFLLIIPALILNLLWASRLPPMWQFEYFWRDIPPAIAYGEIISRIAVNVLPVFMPLRISGSLPVECCWPIEDKICLSAVCSDEETLPS